ncbi:transposase [Streptomyces sp. NPDC000941]
MAARWGGVGDWTARVSHFWDHRVGERGRSCFTAPTFRTFCVLPTGLIAQTRRRTVCGMLLGTGLERVWHHARRHRLFSTARWSADEVGLALAGLVMAPLLPHRAPLQVAVDDTLSKRSGKKVFGAAWQHDGAARGPHPAGFGNCRVIAGIVVTVPFLTQAGVPAGPGPPMAPQAHRKDRPGPRDDRTARRPLPRPHPAHSRRCRLCQRAPAWPPPADHLDQPPEGHLRAARAPAPTHGQEGTPAHPGPLLPGPDAPPARPRTSAPQPPTAS